MNNVAQTYLNTQVNTVHQGDILIMLYETAIRHLNAAKEKIAMKDMAEKGKLITKAIDVIHAIDNSLNADYGEDLATNLHNLYTLCTARLLQANLKADSEIIDGVISTLSGIKDAFTEVLSDPAAQAVAQQMSAQKSAQGSAYVARKLTSAPSAGAGKSVGNSAYAKAAKHADIVDNGGEVRGSSQTSLVATAGPQKVSNELNPLMFESMMTQKFASQAQSPQVNETKNVQSSSLKNATQPLLQVQNTQLLGQGLNLNQEKKVLNSSLNQNSLKSPSFTKAPSVQATAQQTASQATVVPNVNMQEKASALVNPLKKANPLSSSLTKPI